MIEPFFTSPPGRVFFTAQMITSPTPATLRLNLPLLLEPRSTLMHMASLAPVLSAMSTWVCCWIMARSEVVSCRKLLVASQDADHQLPFLGNRQPVTGH